MIRFIAYAGIGALGYATVTGDVTMQDYVNFAYDTADVATISYYMMVDTYSAVEGFMHEAANMLDQGGDQ